MANPNNLMHHAFVMTEFNAQQQLVGERLTLRPVTEDDFDNLFAAANDPLLWQQHPQSDRYTLPVFTDYFRGALDCRSAYVVIDNSSGKIIGSSRYDNINDEQGTIEIGWTFLARSHWGGRFNAELKDLMIKLAFEHFQEIHFCIGELNKRSLAAVKKIGAKLTDINDPARPGHVFYAITAETYLGKDNYGKQAVGS